MTLKFLSIPAAVLAMTTLAAAPALAQREHRGEQGRTPQTESRGRSESRGGGERAQPRASAPAPAPRAGTPAQPQPRYDARHGYDTPRRDAPRGETVAPRTAPYAVPRAVPRANYGYTNDGYRGNNGYYRGNNDGSRGDGYRGGYYAGRWGGYAGRWEGYHGYSAFRPYFFRPWYRIGFSINVGYPVAYYAYPYPVPVYGYGAPYDTVAVGPNSTYGGVALQIQPDDAYVYVDGGYAGVAHDFDGTRQPLTLVPGTHHIEITQNGFEPLAFDVTIQPGMVIPYEGGLRPY